MTPMRSRRDRTVRLPGAATDRATVLIPTYREARTLVRTLDALAKNAGTVLIADDDSDDGTREVAQAATPLDLQVLHRKDPNDRGLTASVADAILLVKTDYLVVMDADLQHPPETIPRLVAALEAGADLAVATRSDDGSFSTRRRLVSRVARSLARRHIRRRAGMDLADPMSGFFAMRTDVAQEIVRNHGREFERQGFKVLVDLIRFAPRPLEVAEVPYTFGRRSAGESKLSRRHYLSFLRQLGGPWRLAANFLDLVLTGVLFRFLAVGASGIAINLFTLFGLHEGFGLAVPLAAPLAIEMSVLWNFAWNESWTFRGRDTGTSIGTRLWQFHVASLAGILLQYVTVAGGATLLPSVHYAWWSIAGITLGSAANFFLNLKWTWGVRIESEEDD